MEVGDKKKEIINALQSTSDELLIEEVYELVHPQAGVEDVTLGNLPLELQTKILRALNDYKDGRYITHEEMKSKMQQWLLK
ncbi:hypothetical protein [Segetibacter aerophilus]|uniref:Uncharacterized protein n=1 Tax=Segetibacter aerophilus TaxID=670293 RepID=A0A512BAK5_9BACT|nr:hypothetical protein [Segetibacter aerophilus]GEO08945.1 hypothetical protein SAE01_14410 [Segetibacter aerophilus]